MADTSLVYGKNEVNRFMNFNAAATWNILAGTGSALHSSTIYFDGDMSLKVSSTDKTTTLITNYTAATVDTTIKIGGEYLFTIYLRNDTNEQITGNIRVYKNAVLEKTIPYTLEITDEDTWLEFFDKATLAINDLITFDFSIIDNSGSILGSRTVWIDGIGVYLNDRNMDLPPIYTPPQDLFEDRNVISKNSVYTAVNGDVILADATTAGFTIDLPVASLNQNGRIDVIKTDVTANVVTIDGDTTETINGSLTQTLTAQYDSFTLVCDGFNWFII